MIRYQDEARVETDRARGFTRIWSPSAERLHELAYLFILSWLGERFDREGLHRAHGLGLRVPASGRSALLLMDSGTGKSTLALSLARYAPKGSFELYSDEIPLVGRGKIHPLPIRVAASDETLVRLGWDPAELPEFRRRLYGSKRLISLTRLGPLAPSAKLDCLVLCRRDPGSKEPRLWQVSRLHGGLALLRSMVIGIGVPQMAEHLLRLDPVGLFGLTRIGLSRLACALALSMRIPVCELVLSDDCPKNVERVLGLLGAGRPEEGEQRSAGRPLPSQAGRSRQAIQ